MNDSNKGIHLINHIQSSAIHAGFKQDSSKDDLALIYFPNKTTIAGMFTQNLIKAWPVLYDQEALSRRSTYRAILINSGNANACNGAKGQEVMLDSISLLAKELGIEPKEILVSSTGVIGAPLAFEPFDRSVGELVETLQSESSQSLAEAIMTTDTVPKETAYSVELDGQTIHVGGVAKGAGMIHPNLGTMLAYIVTDIAVDQPTLSVLLNNAVDKSFNNMTVDGDTSTNDTALLCATGEKEIQLTEENLYKLQEVITKVCSDLAMKMAQDGEGRSKFMTINTFGAQSFEDAKAVGKSIAQSNLVKTAMFGEDPNWGRVISAIGNSQVENINPNEIDIFFHSEFGSVQPCKDGCLHPFDESVARHILTASDIEIEVHLGQGDAQASIWTCDLTHDYIVINAEYHT